MGLSSASEVTPSRCQIQRVTWNFKYVCAFSKCLRCVQTVRHCRNRRERVRAQPSENLVFAEYSVFQQNDASMSRKVTGSETARAMFGSLLGSTADADEAYASRLRARLALETEGLDADGAAVLRELRRLEADDPSSPLADADDELVHRAVVTVTEDHGTTVPPARRAKKASECLRRILSWRRDVRADGIVHERLPLTPREFHQRWPVFLAGEDAHGHPVAYERVKDVDAEALLAAMDAEDVIRHRVQIMEALSAHKRRARSRTVQLSNPKRPERLRSRDETEAACPLSRGALSMMRDETDRAERASREDIRREDIREDLDLETRVSNPAVKRGARLPHKHAWVVDLAGVSATGLLFSDAKRRAFLYRLAELMSDKYPDTLHAMWLINAPSAFRAAWVAVRGALSRSTTEKIAVVAAPKGAAAEEAETVAKTLERKFRKGGVGGKCAARLCAMARGTDPGAVPGTVSAASLVETAREEGQ